MLFGEEVSVINSSYDPHARALVLGLLRAANGTLLENDIHLLSFFLQQVASEKDRAFYGLSFFKSSKGPFSPELGELITSLTQEGLVRQFTDNGHFVRLSRVGESFADHYFQLAPKLRDAFHFVLSQKDEIDRLVTSTVKSERFGSLLVGTPSSDIAVAIMDQLAFNGQR